jgi:hypothetical protein
VLYQISKGLKAYSGVVFKVCYDLFGEEPEVLVLQSLREIPVEECLWFVRRQVYIRPGVPAITLTTKGVCIE